MGKKKGLAAIFSKPKLADGSPSPPWPWPSCANNPQTASFHRQDYDGRPCTTAGRSGPPAAAAGGRLLPRRAAGDMYKTVNSVYLDPADFRCFSSFEYDGEDGEEGQGDADDDDALDDGVMSYSTTTASEEWSEAVIRSLGRRTSTDRFFFDSGGPPPASNSILSASRSPSPGRRTLATQEQSPEPNKAPAVVMPDHMEGDSDSDEEDPLPPSSTSALVEESVAVALDSADPYGDFRASMEEMVAAHGLRDWAELEELLSWYLRINGKHNHALIVGAFVDLLVGLATTSSRSGAATTTTTTTTVTMTTTAADTSSSSSTTSSSVAGDGAACSTGTAATTTTLEEEQCGGGSSGTDASCSPAAASSDQEEDEEEPGGGKKASDDELATVRIKLRS